MKKFAKFVVLVLTLSLLLSFVACGKSSDQKDTSGSKTSDETSSSDSTSDKKSGEKVTLTVWGDPDNQAVLEEAFKLINEAFEKKYPNIKLDYQFSGSFDALNVAVQSNSLPDLFWVQGNKSTKMAEMARNGYLLNLDKYNLDTSRFPQGCIDYATVDGSLYCSIPAFLDYVTIYYNKDIFGKYGLSVPETWDDLVNVCETLKQNGEIPIALGGKGDWDRYWFIQITAPVFYNDLLGELQNGNFDVDYAPMAKGFNVFREFVEKGYFGSDVVATDGAGAQLAFTNGKTAMIIDGTWNNSIYESTGMNIGRFAIPDNNGKRYSQSGFSNFLTYAASSKTKYPDEAFKYIEFLSSLEAQQIMHDKVGGIPVVDDIKVASEAIGEMADFDIIGYNVYHVLSAVANENSKPQEILISDICPKVMMGQMTGEQAAEAIKNEIAKR